MCPELSLEPGPWRLFFQDSIFSLPISFRSSLLISTSPPPPYYPRPYPHFFFSNVTYSPTWEQTSIIFAWKLFINLPVKHSIEPFTSYYRNLLGTYWQLSKYLHKALKHLVPSERKKLLCQAENDQTPFPLPFPLFHKGKLPFSILRICLNYPSKLLSQEEKERKFRCAGEEREQHFQHLEITPCSLKNQTYEKRATGLWNWPWNAWLFLFQSQERLLLSAKLTGQVQALRLQPTAQTRPRPAQTPKESGKLKETSPTFLTSPHPTKEAEC